MNTLPLTPRTKKIIALAAKVAKQQGHEYVGTEHLLAGMIIEGEGIAAQLLRESEVTLGVLEKKANFLKIMTPHQEARAEYHQLKVVISDFQTALDNVRAKLDL